MPTPEVTPAAQQLRVKIARTGLIGLVLFLLLMGALAIDKLPGMLGRVGSHARHSGLSAHTRHVAGHTKRPRHISRMRRGTLASRRPVGNCRVRYRHHGVSTALATVPKTTARPGEIQPRDARRGYPSNAQSRSGPALAITAAHGSPVAGSGTMAANPPRTGFHVSPHAVSVHGAHPAGPFLPKAPALPVTGVQPAYLSFYVNGVDQGEVLTVIRDGQVWIALADLERAGLHGIAAPTQTFDGRPYVAAHSLAPGITSTFDEQGLAVRLTAQTQYLGTTTLDMGGNAPPGMTHGKGSSAFLNYALDWQNYNALAEFSELGVSSHGNLYYSGFSFLPGGKFVRGLTNATFDNPARMSRWVVGDSFAQSGLLGGSTFLAGVSVSRNFSLNPYYVRYPGVGLSGQVLTPSTAEIYVNGHLVGTRALAPGQFDITNVPVVAGGGTTQVIVRDAFGRTQTFTSSYYFSTTVLQRGLSEYSYNLGAQRHNVTSSSGDYGGLVFAGFDRVGITDWFTGGARLDGGPGILSVGPTAAFRLGRGQLGLNASYSDAAGLSGGAAEADYSYQNRRLSYGGTLASMSPHYANLSLATTTDRPTTLAAAFAGFELGPRASATLTYSTGQWRDSGWRQDTSLAGSVRLSNKFDLVATAEHFHAITSSNQYTVSLTYQIGRNSIGALSQQGGSSGSGSAVSVQQSLPLGTGIGYRLEHGNGTQIQNDDLVQVQTSFGLYQASLFQINGSTQKDLLASGALVDAGDGIMFTRAVEDGYAVIDLSGLRGVRGYFNNQEIGRTDGKGRLLVPNLIAYYGNRVEISDQDVPLDYSVDATEQIVAPPYRGGALVHFPVKREVAVAGIVVIDNASKRDVPAFGQLSVMVGSHALVAELDAKGAFYLEDVLPGRYAGQVEYANGSCALNIVVPRQQSTITQIGSVACTPRSEVGQTLRAAVAAQ